MGNMDYGEYGINRRGAEYGEYGIICIEDTVKVENEILSYVNNKQLG